jgi:acyl-CoA synthetase (AMP-forming)/AMP-acid ligase II
MAGGVLLNAHSDVAPASIRHLNARPLTVQLIKRYGEVIHRLGAPTLPALVGRPMPLTQVGAMGGDGRLLRSGEIVVRRSLVIEGNRKNLAATAEIPRFNWRHSGDIEYLDEDCPYGEERPDSSFTGRCRQDVGRENCPIGHRAADIGNSR